MNIVVAVNFKVNIIHGITMNWNNPLSIHIHYTYKYQSSTWCRIHRSKYFDDRFDSILLFTAHFCYQTSSLDNKLSLLHSTSRMSQEQQYTSFFDGLMRIANWSAWFGHFKYTFHLWMTISMLESRSQYWNPCRCLHIHLKSCEQRYGWMSWLLRRTR